MKHKNLASERTRLDLNQTECAEKLGISLKLLAKYESDYDYIPGDFAIKAAEFFGCSTDYLLDLTEDRLPKKT